MLTRTFQAKQEEVENAEKESERVIKIRISIKKVDQ
jgi:hypothetical protein